MIELEKGERIEAIVPWAASGPGWSNSGICIVINNMLTGKWRQYPVYNEELGSRSAYVFSVALAARKALTAALKADGLLPQDCTDGM